MGLDEPGPRVHCAQFDEVGAATPTRHWRIGGGNATAAQDVDRITSPDLRLTASREIGKALSQEDQPFVRQPETSKKCLIKDEGHGRIRVSRHSGIVITERLCSDPHAIDGFSWYRLVGAGSRVRVRVAEHPGRRWHALQLRIVWIRLDRARRAQGTTAAYPWCPTLNLRTCEAVGLSSSRANRPLPPQSIGCPRSVKEMTKKEVFTIAPPVTMAYRPMRGEPHARLIHHPAVLLQFSDDEVEASHAFNPIGIWGRASCVNGVSDARRRATGSGIHMACVLLPQQFVAEFRYVSGWTVGNAAPCSRQRDEAMSDVGGETRCTAASDRVHLTAVGGIARHVKGIERGIGCFLPPANRAASLYFTID